MTTISASVIADSISVPEIRLTTLQLRYPRFIHAEFMTHRVFSRNASSSRAVPVEKLIADIERDPAMPLHWGKNQPGMQAHKQLTGYELGVAKGHYLAALQDALVHATHLHEIGAHKQLVNRILEPFTHINVVVTATEWDNFFALRDHPDAEPHIQMLAREIKRAMSESTPKKLRMYEWHLPYVSAEEQEEADSGTLCKISAARCARVSYLTQEGKKPARDTDLALYERLAGSEPLHASPLEHQASPDFRSWTGWHYNNQHGNFIGWRQFRKIVEEEGLV